MDHLLRPSADYRSVAEEVPIKARLRALQSIVAGIYRLFGILDQVEKIGQPDRRRRGREGRPRAAGLGARLGGAGEAGPGALRCSASVVW